jgi:hypothetical protein
MARPRCSDGYSTSTGSSRKWTVFDKSGRTDGTFSRQVFTYDHAGDVYRCPGGKTLTTTGTLVNDEATILYRASKHMSGISLRSRCCPNTPARKVPPSIH